MTAHFLGGCVIGADAEHGVVDGWHRVFGHPGLHVVDGSAVSANLGANPSLTITAQAERAMSFWPDTRRARPATAARLGVPTGRRRSPASHPAVPGMTLVSDGLVMTQAGPRRDIPDLTGQRAVVTGANSVSASRPRAMLPRHGAYGRDDRARP